MGKNGINLVWKGDFVDFNYPIDRRVFLGPRQVASLQYFFFILNCFTSYPSPATQTHVIIGSFNVTWADARIITKVRSADSTEKRNIDSVPCRIGRIFPCDARRCNAARCIQHPRSEYRKQNVAALRDCRIFRTLGGDNSRNCDYRGPFFHRETHMAPLPFDFVTFLVFQLIIILFYLIYLIFLL